MGRVHLVGWQGVKIVTGIDDHSRFIVCVTPVLRATTGRCAWRWRRPCADTGPEQFLTAARVPTLCSGAGSTSD